MPLERPSQTNLNHSSKLYKESGSENDNVVEFERGKKTKKMKKLYTLTLVAMTMENGPNYNKSKNQERSQNTKKSRYNEKAHVTKERTLSDLGKNIFIGDSGATSPMTSNKIGV